MLRKKYVNELFLGLSYIPSEEWNKFLLTVSKYIGYFNKWELVINIEMNEIRYFVMSSKELPSTIGDFSNIVIKPADINLKLNYDAGFFSFISEKDSIIDIYDKYEINKLLKLKQLRVIFKLNQKDYKSSIKAIFEDVSSKKLISKKIIGGKPYNILSINYLNSRFFYKKKPKYLNIQKSLHLLKSDPSNSILKIDTFPYLNGNYYLNQNSYNFDKHSMIIGGSGTGKSKLISLFINNLNNNSEARLKYRIIVIDPHANIENDIGGLNNIKILDYLTQNSSSNLFSSKYDDVVSSTENILLLFRNILKEQYNSKMERMLRYTLHLLLIKKEFSFFNIRKLLLDTNYRLDLINELKGKLPEPVEDFFLNDFNELKTRSYTETISPIISFVDSLVLLPGFNNKKETDDLSEIIKNNFITLFSLNKNKLGESATKIITNLVIYKIMELVQSKIFNENIILIIDEIASVESDIIPRLLSEARKYNLSLFMATQYFNQISLELRNSIYSNISNYYVFRVSKEDAKSIEENLQIKLGNDDSVENRIKLLTELNDRECIVRVNSNGIVLPAFKTQTLNFISKPTIIKEIKEVNVYKDIKPNDNTTKRPFSIKSKISLNDIMIEQSTSRRKVR